MTITVELPDDLATHKDAGREALEALVIAGYRSGRIPARLATGMLGMGRLAFEELLEVHGVDGLTYGAEELLEDIATCDRLRTEGMISG